MLVRWGDSMASVEKRVLDIDGVNIAVYATTWQPQSVGCCCVCVVRVGVANECHFKSM